MAPLTGAVFQVDKFVAPKPESVEAVQTWLKDNGVAAQTLTPAGDWISAKIPLSKANAMLDAYFQKPHVPARGSSTQEELV